MIDDQKAHIRERWGRQGFRRCSDLRLEDGPESLIGADARIEGMNDSCDNILVDVGMERLTP